MGSLGPVHIVILSGLMLLLLGGYGHARRRSRVSRVSAKPALGFFHGMNAATSLALAGAMLLALALVVDVYGPDWMPGALSDNLSLGLAGSGGAFTLLSLFLNRRSRSRG